MKVLILLMTLIYSISGFSESFDVGPIFLNTGIEWDEEFRTLPIKCKNNHNIRRLCLQKGKQVFSCSQGYPANMDMPETDSTVVKCTGEFYYLPGCQDLNDFEKNAKKYMSGTEVCNISATNWPSVKNCYNQDQVSIRSLHCPFGCTDVPKTHVCDWTEDQYNKYKNCSSLKFTVQQTRENICPSGAPGLDPILGSPARIKFLADRIPNTELYHTFQKGFKIELSSLSSKIKADGTIRYPKFCIESKGTTSFPCVWFEINTSLSSKYTFRPGGVAPNFLGYGVYTIKVINGSGLVTKVDFEVTYMGGTNSTIPCPVGSVCKWYEIVGPDLSPIQEPNNNATSAYEGQQTCTNLYEEVKDKNNRRWKCFLSSPSGTGIAGSGGTFGMDPTEIDCRVVRGEACNYSTDGNSLVSVRYFKCACGDVFTTMSWPEGYTRMGTSQCYQNIIPEADLTNTQRDHCLDMGTAGSPSPHKTEAATYSVSPDSWLDFVINPGDLERVVHFENTPPDEVFQAFMNHWQTPREQGVGFAKDVFYSTGYPPTGQTVGCSDIEPKCTASRNLIHATITCTGGATPPTTVPMYDWSPFIYPGMYRYYHPQPPPGTAMAPHDLCPIPTD